jgi:hypothetical protein
MRFLIPLFNLSSLKIVASHEVDMYIDIYVIECVWFIHSYV